MTLLARMPVLALVLAALGACRRTERAPMRESVAAAAAPAATRLGGLPEGSFAYPDTAGAELLALAPVPEPLAVRWAMCGTGVKTIEYARTQTRQDSSSGRQVAGNLRYEGGQVFRTRNAPVDPDRSCYITADSGMASQAVLPGPLRAEACDSATIRAASQRQGRTVSACTVLAQAGGGRRVLAMQFALVDTMALASLVLVAPQRVLYLDFPAKYPGPEEDIWRVDDGGRFEPSSFTILFFTRCTDADCLALTWAGSEGEDEYLAVADSADALRVAKQQYRYWF